MERLYLIDIGIEFSLITHFKVEKKKRRKWVEEGTDVNRQPN